MNICLTMVVKNEAHCIERALRSALPFISSYAISDTGSTDNTKAIIADVLKDIPGVLTSDAWIDFPTNRNLVLTRASGDYCLALDADEILHGTIPDLTADAYQIKILEGDDVHLWSNRIHRNDGEWRWEGAVHETPHRPGNPVIARLEFVHITTPHDGARDKSGNKAEELLAIYESIPDPTPRDIFNYARALWAAGRTEDAIRAFTIRAKLGGWPEEVYYSSYQVGVLKLDAGDINGALAALLKAYWFRPSRYEALVWACMVLRTQGRHSEAYTLSYLTPQQPDDVLFVEKSAAWRVLEEHSLAAEAMGMKPEYPPDVEALILKNS